MTPSKVWSCGVLCLVVLLAPALQGCVDQQEQAERDTGAKFEEVAAQDLSDASVVKVQTATAAVVADPDDENAKNSLVKALEDAGLVDLFDTVTVKAVAKIENGMLVVNITMKPIRMLGGLIRLSRSENSMAGPIFALNIPLLQGTNFDPNEITKDLTRTHAHIEGYVYVTMFCWGHFKMLINHEGQKFHIHIATMQFWEMFIAAGNVTVSDANEVRGQGHIGSWFTDDLAEKAAQAIADTAKVFTDKIQAAQAEVEAQCKACGDLDIACKTVKCLLSQLMDAARQLAGAAFTGAEWIVENAINIITKIFVLNEASFDIKVDPNAAKTTYLNVKFDAVVFGHHLVKEATVNLADIAEAAKEVARLFAPEIFDQADKLRRLGIA